MLDPIIINRKEAIQILGIDEAKFERNILPFIRTITCNTEILFRLEDIKLIANSSNNKFIFIDNIYKPIVDGEGKVLRNCDEDTAKLKYNYKKLPKASQSRLDNLILKLQGIADKAHGRLKG